MEDIKEKVIDMFDDYLNSVKDEYGITNEEIQYLKKKVESDVKDIISNEQIS